jgi:hypothetical protein
LDGVTDQSVFTNLSLYGHAMAEAVSHWPLTMGAQASSCGICGGQSDKQTGFLCILCYPSSESFHQRPYSRIMWDMNNRPLGGHSSET